MTLYFSNYLTATRTLTSGYIKWNPDVAFTFSFLDIVFGQYVRWGMGENTDTKNVEWVFCRQFLLNKISHRVMFVSWYMRVLSMKSRYLLDNILHFIDINHICCIIRYDIKIFYHTSTNLSDPMTCSNFCYWLCLKLFTHPVRSLWPRIDFFWTFAHPVSLLCLNCREFIGNLL